MIYVHVPFCRSFCTYCDFYSEVAARCRNAQDAARQESAFGRYAEALEAEIRARKSEIQQSCAADGVSTIYIGGGTPSVLPLGVLRQIVDALKDALANRELTEFTVEVNPEDIVDKGVSYVEGLLALGVNRISMGIQSFDDSILKWMNRRHDSLTAVKAYGILESAGVENISIDLIFGLPQISEDLWRETLKRALNISSRGLMPRHISSYQLSVEPGSMLARMVDKGMWNEASDELCQKQYMILCEVLKGAGYNHYEISNFALPGYEAVHNSAYWKHVPYIGLGPGAHSFVEMPSEADAAYVRKWNADNLEEYIRAAEKGDFSDICGSEILSEEQMRIETVMLGLRTASGLREEELHGCCDAGAVDAALECGDLIMEHEGRFRIPESRFFISDNIISSII